VFNRSKGAQSSALLQRGVELSMKLQRSVVRHGCGLMDKSGVTRLKRFRYAFLQSLPDGDQDVFSKPIALSRLALFLVDANRVRRRTRARCRRHTLAPSWPIHLI
jgi:hypothetical protein